MIHVCFQRNYDRFRLSGNGNLADSIKVKNVSTKDHYGE